MILKIPLSIYFETLIAQEMLENTALYISQPENLIIDDINGRI